MVTFLRELDQRNQLLSRYGWLCLAGAVVLLIFMPFYSVKVLGINALIKPTKFLISTVIFSWTMAWILDYLSEQRKVKVFSWVVVIVLSFENIYISWQAFLGQTSHFNGSTPFHEIMFGLMGLAVGVMTLWTAYMGLLFFRSTRVELPTAYLWAIRLGILLFVLFALEGYAMGAILAHTVGAPDGGEGLPFVNWSKNHGDLRIAHFLGMHALQIIPLVGYYVLRKLPGLLLFALAYFALVTIVLMQAFRGLPLLG